MNLRLLLVVGSLFISVMNTCAHPDSHAPDWVSGRSDSYPADRYLLGIGEGPTRSVAEERAYAAVARIFQTEVQARSMDVESYSLRHQKGAETRSRSLSLQRWIHVSTSKILENVAILDAWRREEDHHYVVLAGLDRRQVERILLDRLAEQDRVLEQAVTKARTGETLLERIRGAKRALRALKKREIMNTDLRVVRISGQGVASGYRYGQIREELDAMLARFVVALAMEGAFARELQQAVLEGLNREGLLPSTTIIDFSDANAQTSPAMIPSPHVLIAGRAAMWEVDVSDPLFRYVRWCAELRVTALETQTLLGAFTKAGREGHITDQEARARASRVMQASISTGLVETLDRYFYDEPQQESAASGVCPE